jgi:hypothetical protein
LATPNYGYEKRQKELAKRKKKEEKLKSKAERKLTGEGDAPENDEPDSEASKPAEGGTASEAS